MTRTFLRTGAAMLLAAATMLPAGCARRDRCYVEQYRYAQMRDLFEQTGSLQRVLDAMADDEWPQCERNEVVDRLRKDLFLSPEDLEQVPPGTEPAPEG
ncbi:MAG: hypothetical protein SF028_14365 [Candidatus Sumerlaeia bacterium]|nr:hypothetical protein [Candidatus Sumerlaeia bacterium]